VTVRFFVAGRPAPKGSKRAFVRGGRAVLVESSKQARPWEQQVHWTARDVVENTDGLDLLPCSPMKIAMHFEMPRVQRLRKCIGVVHDRKPDLDKLARNVMDALTGVLWADDAQVWSLKASKAYVDPGYPPGVRIEVEW